VLKKRADTLLRYAQSEAYPPHTDLAYKDEPMRQWLPLRGKFVAEFIRGAGRGGVDGGACSACGDRSPLFRCKDCFSIDLLCSGCMVKRHADNPLHVVEVRSILRW
jgi:hypothetical protein